MEPYPIDNYGGNASWMAVDEATEAKFPMVDATIADKAISKLHALKDGTVGEGKPFFLAVGSFILVDAYIAHIW